jgi:membrane-associated protease RseP (regulator of RpoE activity)
MTEYGIGWLPLGGYVKFQGWLTRKYGQGTNGFATQPGNSL